MCVTFLMWHSSHMSNLPHRTDDLVTTAEAAEISGKSVSTVNRWADCGRLPVAAKAPGVRGARFFHKSDVEQLTRVTNAA